jgi:hypothetical protein
MGHSAGPVDIDRLGGAGLDCLVSSRVVGCLSCAFIRARWGETIDHVCSRAWVYVVLEQERKLRVVLTSLRADTAALSMTVHWKNRVSGLLSLGSLANWMKFIVQTALFDLSRLRVDSTGHGHAITALQSHIRDLERVIHHLEWGIRDLENDTCHLESVNRQLESLKHQLAHDNHALRKLVASLKDTARRVELLEKSMENMLVSTQQ